MSENTYRLIENTGALNGAEFQSEAQVREYFTIANMREMFGPDTDADADELAAAAQAMIDERLNCAF